MAHTQSENICRAVTFAKNNNNNNDNQCSSRRKDIFEAITGPTAYFDSPKMGTLYYGFNFFRILCMNFARNSLLLGNEYVHCFASSPVIFFVFTNSMPTSQRLPTYKDSLCKPKIFLRFIIFFESFYFL